VEDLKPKRKMQKKAKGKVLGKRSVSKQFINTMGNSVQS
jgi:hypothetical protein